MENNSDSRLSLQSCDYWDLLSTGRGAIKSLILLLQQEKNADNALKYSQAALNLTHVLKNHQEQGKPN